ncbi:MAG: membrane protease subunit, stomatin/prohibitin [Snowella sp.]|jgi:regulator of protease activity HflC (stomatin/prohibitin superfamily)|nr:MAG: membrane protease subunit, stomatin/prohibitin [Snowella sp.]
MSLIVSAIAALVSWLVFFTSKFQDNSTNNKLIRPIALLIGLISTALVAIQALGRFAVVIPTGEVGVIETLGKVSATTLNPGIHFLNPFTEVVTFSTRIQDLKETVDSTSKEGLNFKIDVSLQYRLDPLKAGEVFQKIGDPSQEKEIITSRFRSFIRQITANYTLTEIYGEKRSLISQSLQQAMITQLKPLGFIVEETLLRNIVLPENIQAAIQEKVAMEQETQKIALEVIKAKKESERKIVEARGTADAQKILSEGLTDKIIQLKAIEATQELAKSPNSKVIIFGGGKDKLPLILSDK